MPPLLASLIALCVATNLAFAVSALEEGLSLFVAGEFERARGRFAEHLAAQPDDPTALYHLGLLEPDAGKSKSYFERVLQAHPDDPLADRALFEIGLFYYSSPLDLYGMARQEFQRLIEMYPRSPLVPQAHYRIGLIDLIEGSYESSRNSFQRAILTGAESEVSPTARASIAESYLLDGNPSRAVREARSALDEPGTESVASHLLRIAAQGLEQMGRYAGADSLRAILLTHYSLTEDAQRIRSEHRAAGPTSSSPGEPGPPARPEGEGAPEPSNRLYLVQIGVFGHTPKAQALLDRLRMAGFQVRDEIRTNRGKTLRVFTSGPFADPTEARRIADEIDRLEHLGCRVAQID